MYDNKGSYSSRRIEFFIKDDTENFQQEVDGYTPILSMNPRKEDKLNKGEDWITTYTLVKNEIW